MNYLPAPNEDFRADYAGKLIKFQISWSEVETKSIELFSLGSFQSFGLPFTVKNEDHIEIYSGQVSAQEFDLQKDLLNYNILSQVPTEVYKIESKTFLQLVKNKSLKSFKQTLGCLMTDNNYRRTFLANEDWVKLQK